MRFTLITTLFSAAYVSSSPILTRTADPYPYDPGFDIEKVVDLAKSLPSHSWEYGAATEALLELYNPELSVFGSYPFPVQYKTPSQVVALEYAASRITIGTGPDALSKGDGAVGDPASLGVAAIMLGKTDKKFAAAAADQLNYTLYGTPKEWNGAISTRVDVPELWADFVYMAPPFMAYAAADTYDLPLLKLTVEQISLYRQILISNGTEKVWHHIIGPQSQDLGLWSTGNGWVAGGVARVLATVMKAPVALLAGNWRQQAIDELTSIVKEIIDGAMAEPTDGGLLRNYLDDTTTGHGFGEVSGSTMLASVVYRMAILQPKIFGASYIKWAEGIRQVIGQVGHVTDTGIVTPAVNPLGWSDTKPFTTGSPEGQAFAVLMYAAWRDCVKAGKCAGEGSGSRK